MIGKFDYRKNCSLPHFIPQGVVADGFPVIIFPQRNAAAIPGHTYEFEYRITAEAKYTIDGEVYRVAHATLLHDTNGKEADFIDQIIHKPRTLAPVSLADHLPSETLSALEALKVRLAG